MLRSMVRVHLAPLPGGVNVLVRAPRGGTGSYRSYPLQTPSCPYYGHAAGTTTAGNDFIRSRQSPICGSFGRIALCRVLVGAVLLTEGNRITGPKDYARVVVAANRATTARSYSLFDATRSGSAGQREISRADSIAPRPP
jgi:hypothetical protein